MVAIKLINAYLHKTFDEGEQMQKRSDHLPGITDLCIAYVVLIDVWEIFDDAHCFIGKLF